jgi:hypothetical protein
MDREELWRLVIETEYDSIRGSLCSKEVTGPFGVGIWKFIRRGWKTFSKFVRYEAGDGSNVNFLYDVWCGDSPLKISYPNLFSIAWRKDAWVVDNLQFREGNMHWNVTFTKPIQDWEVEVVLSFFERLYSFRLRQGDDDRIGWSASKGASLK